MVLICDACIINCVGTCVVLSQIVAGKTKDVFIECTATDLTKANVGLNTMVPLCDSLVLLGWLCIHCVQFFACRLLCLRNTVPARLLLSLSRLFTLMAPFKSHPTCRQGVCVVCVLCVYMPYILYMCDHSRLCSTCRSMSARVDEIQSVIGVPLVRVCVCVCVCVCVPPRRCCSMFLGVLAFRSHL